MKEGLDYNTLREKIVLPEFGRSIQNMVSHAITISDREKRQCCAETIVRIMANMYSQQKGVNDFMDKLWNHIAVISNFKLDIDYPCEIIKPEELHKKPDHVAYPTNHIRLRHYGHLLECLFDKLKEMEPGEDRDELVCLVANQMKQSLFMWNKDALNEEKIAEDLARFTDGKVHLKLDDFAFAPIVPSRENINSLSFRSKRKRK